MKTIGDYKILCTPEQTKKLLELGAPIEYEDNTYPTYWRPNICRFAEMPERTYHIPTAEQVIGWLEEQADILDINIEPYEDDSYPSLCGYGFSIRNKNKEYILGTFTEKGDMVYISPTDGTYCHYGKLTKREATIEVIDAALEYLETYKQ